MHGSCSKEGSEDSSEPPPPPPREGLAARAARLQAEALERRRRRWTGAEHYLSELSLTQEERGEPGDAYRLTDVTWADVSVAAAVAVETSSLGETVNRHSSREVQTAIFDAIERSSFPVVPRWGLKCFVS